MTDPELMKFLDDLINVFSPANNEIGRRALVILERLKNPTPTGETVRARAGFWWNHHDDGWRVYGASDDPEFKFHCIPPTYYVNIPIPLPRIPVVEARVVEGGEA